MPMRNLTIVAAGGTWVVRAGGAVIGESARAVELSRDGAATTIFFPREDLGMAFLEASPETGAKRGSSWRTAPTSFMPGTSAAVSTATTPGAFAASVVSIDTTRARA